MPTIGIQPSLEETQAVGAALLHQFMRDRFLEAGIDDEIIREAESKEQINQLTKNVMHTQAGDTSSRNTSEISDGSTLVEDGDHFHSVTETTNNNDRTLYQSVNETHSQDTENLDRMQSLPIMASYGRELRKIADEFAKSRLRQTLKDRAAEVQLTDINKVTFIQLLEELFKGGITRERIVALFFFCSDVALRAVSFAQDLTVKLLGWSFSYIINTVCKIVHELGGWDDILFRQLPYLLFNCLAVFGVFALAAFLLRGSYSSITQ